MDDEGVKNGQEQGEIGEGLLKVEAEIGVSSETEISVEAEIKNWKKIFDFVIEIASLYSRFDNIFNNRIELNKTDDTFPEEPEEIRQALISFLGRVETSVTTIDSTVEQILPDLRSRLVEAQNNNSNYLEIQDILRTSIESLLVLIENWEILSSGKTKFVTGVKKYTRAVLGKVGLESMESLYEKRSSLVQDRYKFQHALLGKIRNKKRITSLSKDISLLDGITQEASDFDKYKYPRIDEYRVMDKQRNFVTEVCRRIMEISHTRLRAMVFSLEQSILSKTFDFSEDVGLGLVEDIINDDFKAKIKELENEGITFSQAELEEAEKLIKEMRTTEVKPWSFDDRSGADKEREFESRKLALPYKLGDVVGRLAGSYGIQGEGRTIFSFLANLEKVEGLVTIERDAEVIKKMLEEFSQLDRKILNQGINISWTNKYATEDIRRIIKNLELITDIFLKSFDDELWQVFIRSEEVKRIWGEERVEKFKAFVEKLIFNKLLKSSGHTEESNRWGYKALSFKSQESVPIILFNSFREPGYSGEFPFITSFSAEGPLLKKYLDSLPEELLLQLYDSGVPGIREVIETIKNETNSKDNLGQSSFYDYDEEKTKEWKPYKKIAEGLLKMCIYYFEQGREDLYLILVETIKQLEIGLGGVAVYFERILKDESENPEKIRLKEVIIECLESRMHDREADPDNYLLLLGNYEQFGQATQDKIKSIGFRMISGIIGKDLDETCLETLGKILEINNDEVQPLLKLFDKLKQLGYLWNGYNMKREEFLEYVRLSKDERVFNILQQLGRDNLGWLSSSSFEVLFQLADQGEEVVEEIKKIKKYFPDYRYFVDYRVEWNNGKSVIKFDIDPYIQFSGGSVDEVLRGIDSLHNEEKDKQTDEKKEIAKKVVVGLFKRLRQRDKNLIGAPELSPEEFSVFSDSFYEALMKTLKLFEVSSYKDELKLLILNFHALNFLARQPEKVDQLLSLPEKAPHLFSLISVGGPLYSNVELILEDIFSNGNCIARAQEIELIFTKKISHWKRLFLFTDTRIGHLLAYSKSNYLVAELPKILVPKGRRLAKKEATESGNIEGFNMSQDFSFILRPISEMSIIEKRRIANLDKMSDEEVADLKEIPFTLFKGIYKKMIYGYRIYETLERSRDENYKNLADQRNRANLQQQLTFDVRSAVHGTSGKYLDNILLNGNLPKESLGEGCDTDAFAFHFDFWKVGPEEEVISMEDLINKTGVSSYVGKGSNSKDGMMLVYDRSRSETYDYDHDFYAGVAGSKHYVILGGMPSSEISAIILSDSSYNLELCKRKILENGFYIPVYDQTGKLIFTPEEFDKEFADRNMGIPVEVLDTKLKTGEQEGSNLGAKFLVPGIGGPVEYYVKFSTEEDDTRLWNEQLADNIYRYLGLPVPNTQVVKIDNYYGHASEMLPVTLDKEIEDDLTRGFIVDAVLANWDVVANSSNIVVSGRRQYRIDNGGSLLFRARGERKIEFGPLVIELQTMKYGYPHLNDEEIKRQVLWFEERFTDEIIDKLVDEVRLPKVDRDFLKDVLRKRRDYVVDYFATDIESEKDDYIPEQGRIIEGLLSGLEIDDQELAKHVPEWEKLVGQEGYQHNGVLLGDHIKDTIKSLNSSSEFSDLSEKEKNIAVLAMLFHDFGKPTGDRYRDIPRDFNHEIPSASIAAIYLKKWGYSNKDISMVVKIIMNDGVVSDIARGKVRDGKKNFTPQELRSLMGNDISVIRILRAVNRADVIGTVGEDGYEMIANRFNDFFEAMIKRED